MPLSASSQASLQAFRQANPAQLEKLLDQVKAGSLSATEAADQVPGLTAADIQELSLNGLEDLASNRDAQALGRAGTGAASDFGGVGPGGTLAAKGVLFNQTFETGAAAQGALASAATRELGVGENIMSLIPEFSGGGKSVLKGLGVGLASAGGAFFVNPFLSPVALVVGFYMGIKPDVVGQRKIDSRDPITAEEGAALKAAFDGASPTEKGAIAAATAAFDRSQLEVDPAAAKALDEIAAHARTPAGQQAARFLVVGDAVRDLLTYLAPPKRGKKKKKDPPDLQPLTAALGKLSPDELEEVRPFLWDALHDDKGNPSIDLDSDPQLKASVFSDKNASQLAAYMVAAFCAQGSHGGGEISKKEVNVLLSRLDRFDKSVSYPALEAAGEQMAQLPIQQDAARYMARVLDTIAAETQGS
jgi:hypothetical protein